MQDVTAKIVSSNYNLFYIISSVREIFFLMAHLVISERNKQLCVPSLTQQKDFNLSSFLFLLLLEDPLNLFVHSDGPLLLLRQTAHTGAAAELPAARHGRKALK